VELKVPANSRNGSKLRLKGRGLPGKMPGDFYVDLQVVLPPADNKKAKDVYAEMARELDFDPRANLGGYNNG
jgi:curved DNA-binding protein